MQQPDTELLPFVDFNPNASHTILLIHGAFSNHREWNLVWPHLKDYHIIVPDLPGHGDAFRIPFSIPLAATMLHDLILARAHNQIAHIVGLSLGAEIAVRLAGDYPEAVSDSFVTGFGGVSADRGPLTPLVPYVVWLMTRIEWTMPRSLVRWLMDGTDLRRPDLSKVTLARIRQIFRPLEWPQPWRARTLVVAAGKKGILPTDDNLDQARRLAATGRQMNSDTRAVTCAHIRHPWSRQCPELFAECVRNWLEMKQLPADFVPLS